MTTIASLACRALAPLALAALLAGCAPLATVAGHDIDAVKGTRPSYGPAALNRMANEDAVARRIWAPDLDLGFTPQGIAVLDDQLLVSGYRSLDRDQSSGPCWLVRVAAGTGAITGRLAIPAPCRHAGGVAVADGTIYVSDTNSLFAIPVDSAFGDASAIRRIPLAGFNGAYATSAAGLLWIGTYDEDAPGKIHGFDPETLRGLGDGQALSPDAAKRTLPTVTKAQGAAFDPDGTRLWIAQSGITSGALDLLDAESGARLRSYDTAAAIEGIAFDGSGRLWAASEAGSRHYYGSLVLQMALPFHPLLFQLRPGDLK